MARLSLPAATLLALSLASSGCSGEGCPAGEESCGGVCVDRATFQTDASNCGACGVACGLGTCVGGACACTSPAVACASASPACVDLQGDPAHCGDCGVSCPAGIGCAAGQCCGAARPVACRGACCAGTGCCASGPCQVQHSNGLGQPFYDCTPLGTYDAAQAEEAARAWQPGGAQALELTCPIGCLGWRTAAACAVWCWGTGPSDPLRGRVALTQSLVCVCPSAGSPIWN